MSIDRRCNLVLRVLIASAVLSVEACSGSNAAPPPPAEARTAPPGQALVTVSASSVPPGATVTGGGRMLGTTPFTTQVPVPVAAPGQSQIFQFTFQLPGYAPATLSASPINSTVTLNVALTQVPPTGVVAPNGTPGATPARTGATTAPEGSATNAAPGATIRVRGQGGGPITDMHTTTSTARVAEACTISELTVDIDGNHTFSRDLVLSLRAPDGEGFTLQNHSARNPFRRHTVRRAVGHASAGAWTLAVADTVNADTGSLRGFTLEIHCR